MKKLTVFGFAIVAVCPAFAGEWTFTNGQLTGDGWVLNATDFNTNEKRITVSGYVSGEGSLDLSAPIVNGVELEGVRFWNEVFKTARITDFSCDRIQQTANDFLLYALFRDNTTLKTLRLGGSGVHTIWHFFASGCTSLERVSFDMPNLKSFQPNAFKGCSALVQFDCNSGLLEEIGDSAFAGCANLSQNVGILCPPSVKKIGRNAFEHCKLLNGKLELSGVEYMGRAAFSGTGIQAVNLSGPIEDGNWSRGDSDSDWRGFMFYECASLTNVVFSLPNLRRVAQLDFAKDSALSQNVSSIVSPEMTSIGSRAFEGCSSLTGKLVLTNLTYLGDAAFAWTKILDLDLRGPVTDAGWVNSAYGDGVRFSGVVTITNAVFDLPNLSSLSSRDFLNCWRLKSVYFLRKPFNAESMRYLLNGKGLSPRDCTIYVSSVQWPVAEWAAGGWRALTEDEKNNAAKPPRCFGMCDVGDPSIEEGDGKWTQQRLAWFARWKSPCDPERFLVILR